MSNAVVCDKCGVTAVAGGSFSNPGPDPSIMKWRRMKVRLTSDQDADLCPKCCEEFDRFMSNTLMDGIGMKTFKLMCWLFGHKGVILRHHYSLSGHIAKGDEVAVVCTRCGDRREFALFAS